MEFHIGETVRIGAGDFLRRGEMGRITMILPRTPSFPFPQYLVEFENQPKAFHFSSERFLTCRYREEELIRED